jgi:transposase
LTAAFDVHTGGVFGVVTRRRTKQDLLGFLEALARRYPQQTVHVVWDNLNTHSGAHIDEFNRRHGGRFRFHYTPIHASWCNQIELWFSILARRVLRRGSFADGDDLEVRVVRFIELWNRHERHPFRWTFTGYRCKLAPLMSADDAEALQQRLSPAWYEWKALDRHSTRQDARDRRRGWPRRPSGPSGVGRCWPVWLEHHVAR